jgi:hypothetical protein
MSSKNNFDLHKFILFHKSFASFKTWTKEKHEADKQLRNYLKEQTSLISINSNRDSPMTKVHFTHQFTIFKVPDKQRGNLKGLRGANVLMILNWRSKFNYYLDVIPLSLSDTEIIDIIKDNNLCNYEYYKDLMLNSGS